jgi:anti-anti-sigma factor
MSLVGPDAFRCVVQQLDERARVEARGELDLATAPDLEAALTQVRAAGARSIELDLAGLSFIDSTGVKLLWQWTRQSGDVGFVLRLKPGPPAVQRVFEITGLTRALPFDPPQTPGRPG